MKKLAIIITHPIQYYVPVFRLMAQQCKLKVFYTWGVAGMVPKHDPGFGKTIAWDLPMLDGYDYELLENISANPGSHHGKGIINPDIISKIEEFSPNAILIYGYIYDSHLKAMRHFKGKIPIWFRGDSTLLGEQFGFKAIAKKLYLKWVYSHVDKAFYVGTNNKAYFKKYGLKEKQLVFAPHAVDNKRFAEDRKAESNDLRESLGVANEDILILFAGKLEPNKNPELLLDAFIAWNKEQQAKNKELKCEISPRNLVEMTAEKGMSSNKKVHLLFVGNGVLQESLKLKAQVFNAEIASYLAMTNSIHFMDFQNQTQMPVVYQACNIYCLPSKSETWGLAVNEAMAVGKAIIVSDKVGCAIDLVQDGINGYIFRSNDMKDLTEKLNLLFNHSNLLADFRKQSQQLIKNWGFEHQVEQFITTLNATN
ncbi:glycosyltransferase family 4 protein [Pedobacter sp. ASV28]|uniref:glycosyltransferase family 4 protein n=1 Tax=Pedobacter sp. ASV28 TaxID=2795123 RepID=UPI001E4CF515|nr:glycosyltransferase family 4 protein [Pedobacter sp. ASV28]